MGTVNDNQIFNVMLGNEEMTCVRQEDNTYVCGNLNNLQVSGGILDKVINVLGPKSVSEMHYEVDDYVAKPIFTVRK